MKCFFHNMNEVDLGEVVFLLEMRRNELDGGHCFPGLRRQRQWLVLFDLVVLHDRAILSVVPRPRWPLVTVLSNQHTAELTGSAFMKKSSFETASIFQDQNLWNKDQDKDHEKDYIHPSNTSGSEKMVK